MWENVTVLIASYELDNAFVLRTCHNPSGFSWIGIIQQNSHNTQFRFVPTFHFIKCWHLKNFLKAHVPNPRHQTWPSQMSSTWRFFTPPATCLWLSGVTPQTEHQLFWKKSLAGRKICVHGSQHSTSCIVWLPHVLVTWPKDSHVRKQEKWQSFSKWQHLQNIFSTKLK